MASKIGTAVCGTARTVTALDYEIIDIKKTKIVDVYEYKENKKEE